MVRVNTAPDDLLVPDGPGTTSVFDPTQATTELIFGKRNLLSRLPQLRQLRLHCGQQDDPTTDPEYFIAANTLKNRRVAAVLIRHNRNLEACVLFFEHSVCGIGLGLMRGGDATGGSFVIGPVASRVRHVHLAAQALLQHWRIHGVSLTIKASLDYSVEIVGPANKFRTFTQRAPQHKLELAETYSAMLTAMGPRTRRSLATKRRQLEQKTGVLFLPALGPAQAMEAMLKLRTRSWPERIAKFCDARYALLGKRPEFFSMGMRLPDGTWLSYLSGWRRDGVTYIDLQMNDGRFKKESISAVMRAYLLEHEIARRQQLISFVGGCSVLLGRYCQPGEFCTDIILARPCLRSGIFKSVIPFVKPESRYERISRGDELHLQPDGGQNNIQEEFA